MATVFALLYVLFFILTIVFFIKSFIDKKKNKANGVDKTVAIVSFVAFILCFVLTGVFAPPVENDNSQQVKEEKSEKTNVTESALTEAQGTDKTEEVVEQPIEQAVEESKQVSESSSEATYATEEDLTAPLIDFIRAYIDHGKVETIKDITEEYGLFMDKKNTGTGGEYYKVALTKEDSKVISLGDLTKGDYCIVIDGKGESLKYYNNVDYIEIDYSDADGYSVIDKTRIEPFEDGSMMQEVTSLDAALEYKPTYSADLSPIEQFYIECQVGISMDEFKELLEKYGLVREYRRSNSSDGHVYYAGGNDSYSYINFDGKDVISDLDFHDYYVYEKYGLEIEYIEESQASKRSGDYPEAGYYIVGDNVNKHFGSAEEAIKELHSYRTK